ncbi:MAG: YqeG family HAD IIIA-type phosphatase [Chloroflexaceae bacterium]|nr:YqeG family HAD IIIA-type phosphatase [Chloroflexaceae bacterium]
MFKSALQPNLVLGGTILRLSPALVQHHQLQGLILDVDETLVPLREKEVSAALLEWAAQIRPVAALWLVSNNISESRIAKIARALDLPYYYGANKPSRRKLRQVLTAMQLAPAQVGMVGDRLFTDILAGNRLGLFTILVEPMVDPQPVRAYGLRHLEVRISQLFGVSLAEQQNVAKPDKSPQSEI